MAPGTLPNRFPELGHMQRGSPGGAVVWGDLRVCGKVSGLIKEVWRVSRVRNRFQGLLGDKILQKHPEILFKSGRVLC